MSLKLKRGLERLRSLSRAIESHGLPRGFNLYHVAALTRALTLILADRDDPARAGKAAVYLYRIAQPSFAAGEADVRLACQRGCALCCHGYVSATAPQIFAAADAVRRDVSDITTEIAHIAATDARTRGLDWPARRALRAPCSMLRANECGIYTARPLACRAFASTSLPACERSFDALTDDVPVPPGLSNVRSALENALRAALQANGLATASYELNAALVTALQTPHAQARWLRGEPVFGAVATDRTEDEGTARTRAIMIETLTSMARGEPPPEFLRSRPAPY